MDFSFLSDYSQFFIDGTKITIGISICTLILGFLVGVIVCMARISRNKIFSILGSIYIEFLRGTPLLVQIYIIYFGFPTIGIKFPDVGPIPSEYISAIVALSINSSAYIAEILRSGIQSVDKGQMEASRSLGFDYSTSMRLVIIPQALKNVLPALANEFIVLVKESSIVSVIGIQDLMYSADIVKGNTYLAFEPLLVAAMIYFVLTFTLSKLVGLFELKLENKSVRESKSAFKIFKTTNA
ncbi:MULTISPECIES: amino acid ABC transporter permease [Paraclostridium]|jgi:His/Glu/Gln/Arg/opine family amino acid ABC transporter permease subunit|uniref:Amino acid ABC transporter permease n=1 Tax=Paraclostridium bifermentans TaxID=1490 RepID=A0A5P3XG60_PARBF|nr:MULTISPECIES: amino acid ABC transporter permease [Paraclostridium]MCU9807528.1 amino acid ABC transporter permease [Paraclostridium sp. AKS46]MDV8115521.1 amino acid ABC transporter permease [Bacillus sp. BAU-SS-2023]RDC50127.1 amino acid ABC transporter permease [Acinetobacter sp. RIT592]EQK44572.1 amino ABC transporter, permease, 3-TM region, His/Glu/Gln/Arg/opine family domain protein [[Clostridium] bifermentans ATCC 19299] [Paraclostridium bifermentans ATCC 19299]MBZ6007009.1 amino aci